MIKNIHIYILQCSYTSVAAVGEIAAPSAKRKTGGRGNPFGVSITTLSAFDFGSKGGSFSKSFIMNHYYTMHDEAR